MSFAHNLLTAMNAAQLTPTGLSAELEKSGCPNTPQTIGWWLGGERLPRAETLVVLARVLNTTPNDLLSFDPGAASLAAANQ